MTDDAAPTGDVHDFDFLVGSWTVQHRRLKARLAGSTEWEEFNGTSVLRPQWSIWWLDARNLEIEPPVRDGFKDSVGTFLADEVFDGKPIKVRFRWSEVTPTSARWDQAFSPDGGATWETNWEMQFTRADREA